jgi:membrane protein required for colicin V production
MYWLDIAILAVLALAALLGARTGFVGQLVRLVSLAVGLYGTIRLHDRVTPLLEQSVLAEEPAWLIHGAAYAVVFLTIYAVLLTLTLFLDRGVRAAQTRWLDRILGAILGAVKAGLILGLLLVALTTLAPEISQEVTERSSLAPRLGVGAQTLLRIIPEEYRNSLQAEIKSMIGSEE